MSPPDFRHLEHLGVNRKIATRIMLVCQALNGKSVLSVSSRPHIARAEHQQMLELLHALGVTDAKVTSERIAFTSGGTISFTNTDRPDHLRGSSFDIVDGGYLLPPAWRSWVESGGGEVW